MCPLHHLQITTYFSGIVELVFGLQLVYLHQVHKARKGIRVIKDLLEQPVQVPLVPQDLLELLVMGPLEQLVKLLRVQQF